MVDLRGKDILEGAQFTRNDLDGVLHLTAEFRLMLEEGRVPSLASGRLMGSLFFEPSTRTRLSFETAMHRLGGSVVGFGSTEGTSASKGESLTDTIRTVDQYVDLIVIRHPDVGSAREAANVAASPIINGGDGAGQHPTQALLDLFTIQSERGGVDGCTIVLCGDLKHGRTVHAGVELYKHFRCRLVFVSPDELRMPAELTSRLKDQGLSVSETSSLEEALAEADVLYMTRIQRERFADRTEYDRLKDSYVLTRDMVDRVRPGVTVLHPLPRVHEIAVDVDSLPGAAYFRQVRNGVPVRMALIALVLGLAEV